MAGAFGHDGVRSGDLGRRIGTFFKSKTKVGVVLDDESLWSWDFGRTSTFFTSKTKARLILKTMAYSSRALDRKRSSFDSLTVHEAASKAPSHVTNPDPTASVLTSFKTVPFLSKHFVLAVVSSLCQRQPCLKRRQSFFPNQLVVKILTSHRNLRARLWPSTSSKQRTLFFFVTPFLSPAVWEENTLNGVSLPISSVLQIP